MKNIVEVLCFLIMIAAVLFFWFKNEGNIKQTIAYTIWTFIIFWINIPCFFVGVEGLEAKYSFFKAPFDLYNLFGTAYVILENIFLGLLGIRIGKGWEKINYVNDKKIKKMFDDFSNDASELRIIGRDLDFLNDSDYKDQTEHIKKLKDKAMLLCEQTDDIELIKLYHKLLEEGNQVRFYTKREGIANLKAQIKIDMHRNESGLFASKIKYSTLNCQKRFEVNKMESGFILHTISKEFDEVFKNSLNPVIKCIALDLGGVYFDGDLDDFYQYLCDQYEVKIRRKKNDKLNIDDKLMLGEINIREFIQEKAITKYTCKRLTDEDWDNISKKWGKVWSPNEQIKKILEYISTEGIYIVPFSNLDSDNGNKYLREYYLPNCCTEHFFSYEQKKIKPSEEAFEEYFKFVKEKLNIHYPFQILLIDDQDPNISTARVKGWDYIKFINGQNTTNDLVDNLKEKGLLPYSYEILS